MLNKTWVVCVCVLVVCVGLGWGKKKVSEDENQEASPKKDTRLKCVHCGSGAFSENPCPKEEETICGSAMKSCKFSYAEDTKANTKYIRKKCSHKTTAATGCTVEPTERDTGEIFNATVCECGGDLCNKGDIQTLLKQLSPQALKASAPRSPSPRPSSSPSSPFFSTDPSTPTPSCPRQHLFQS